MQPSRSGSQFTIYHSQLTIPTATAWGLDFFERGRQLNKAFDGGEGGAGLRVAPVIEHGDLLRTVDLVGDREPGSGSDARITGRRRIAD
jgi:hypothetical protein